MIQIKDPKDCCGCTACASICTHDAITMEPDTLGFLYPKVDASKCVDCGLCEKVCQFNDNYDRSLNLPQPIAYAARHKDVNEIMRSRSGAAFVAISDYVLEQGGVVYGAGYKDHFRVTHKRAMTKEERDEFRGSKYVQSDLTGVFCQVKDDLKKGMTVLFSGTPCHTSGLNAYVGDKLRDKLILVDIVCHGVPGPLVWRDYITYLEKRQGETILKVDFRDKKMYGWTAHKETYKFGKDRLVTHLMWTRLFYKHIMFRHSCGVCHFTNLKRPSDITLADFWGWEEAVPGFNDDDKGVSLVLCNTPKGRVLFETIKSKLDAIEVPVEKCLQPNLQHPSAIHLKRLEFENAYSKRGFDYIMKQYGDIGWRYKVRTLKGRIKKTITSLIHCLYH